MFVDQVTTTVEGERMVRAVIDLARTLGLTAIAEGVETADQAEALCKLGCSLGQGYYFARPTTADALAKVLDRQPAEKKR